MIALLQKLSLTARLSLLFTTLSCAVLLALGWFIGASIEKHFEEQDHHALSGKLELAQHIIERVNTAQDVANLSDQLSDALVGHHDLAIIVQDTKGKVLLNSSQIQFPETYLHPRTNQPQHEIFSWTQDGQTYRGLVSIYATKNPELPSITVGIATDIAHHLDFMRNFMRSLWLFVFVAALFTGALSWVAASRGLRPLRAMRDRASSVTANKLDQRLSLEAVPPELADLAHSLNQMLERLEEAFQRLSDFSSDLAHELRTPISNLMTQTQVSLSQARDASSYREILESNAEEYSRLARMIADMLFLAKAENGLSLVNREQVNLMQEVQNLFEFYEALAEEKQIRLRLQCQDDQAASTKSTSEQFTLSGDRLMLRRALSNILSNALRHTAKGQEITVYIEADPNFLTMRICNPGPSIPEQHIHRLFERFYRADHARQHADGEGSGLGLAIVQAIVLGHQGTISVRSQDDLTCFTLQLPRTTIA
ncbi:heavy metal sensor histidine kinase [Undibacterium sp. Di24W]|uniref:heavy metal sensor histidine kinase n=1 Tax=Undibacterium sp. Di24W TaxID=3413033 RepID=UPI003BF213DA